MGGSMADMICLALNSGKSIVRTAILSCPGY